MTDEEFAQFLNDISVCFIEKDFALWESRVRLPFSLVTKTGPVALDTREQLEVNFGHYLQAVSAMQVDLVARRPVSIEICDPATVIGTYETNLLNHGARMVAPYISSALIHRTETGWRMSSIMNALGHHHWTGIHPYETGEKE